MAYLLRALRPGPGRRGLAGWSAGAASKSAGWSVKVGNWGGHWKAAVGGLLILVVAAGIVARVMGPGEDAGQVGLDVPPAQDVGPASSGATRPTATAEPSAVLVLPYSAVIQWGELAFSVEGFEPGETVTLFVDEKGAMTEIGQADADGEGKIEDAKILLPSWLESGSRGTQAVGSSSGITASGTLLVRAKELWVNLGSYTARQAAKLGFVAGGFEPDDQVKVYLSGGGDSAGTESQEPLVTLRADEVGNTPWTEVEIPVVSPGKYTLLLKGSNTTEDLEAAITVAPLEPELELSPWSGVPGREVDLNAKGFLPGEQVEVFVGGVTAPVATFEADEFGGLWGAGPIALPTESMGGKLPIMLRGKSSGAEVTRSFSVVAPHPWAELSSYSGFAGAPVVAHGGGFAAGERVTLHVGSAQSPAVAEVVTNEDGFYQGLGPASVPSNAVRDVAFVVVGQSSGTQAEAVFTVMEPFAPEMPPMPPMQPRR